DSLDIPAVGNEDNHVLFRDQVLDVDLLRFLFDDLRAAVVSELFTDLLRLVLYHAEDFLLAGQQVLQEGDECAYLVQLVDDLLHLEAGEALQAHVQDGLRLLLREGEPRDEVQPGGLRVFGLLDDRYDLIDVVQRDLQTFEDMGPVFRLCEVEAGAARDDFFAVLDEVAEHLLEGKGPGQPPHEGEVVDAERRLQ